MISPTLAVRAGGVFQNADVAGRNYTTDDRGGGFVAVTWKPVDAVKVTANYVHTDIHGLPDFGVPYYRPDRRDQRVRPFTTTAGGPFPDFGVNRNNFYGFVNRDFFKVHQDIGTINTEVQVTPDLTLSDKIRASRSLLNYIGTIPESPDHRQSAVGWTLTANPQSRYQPTDVRRQPDRGDLQVRHLRLASHRACGRRDLARDLQHRQLYRADFGRRCRRAFSGAGSLTGVSVFNPQYTFDAVFGTADAHRVAHARSPSTPRAAI